MRARVRIQYLSVRLLFLSASLVSIFRSSGQIDWPTLGFPQVVTNLFNSPTCITHAGDGSGRLFVVEQSGRIWIIRSNAVATVPFLQIPGRVITGIERGLLGLAFPPGSGTNSHFYVDYTRQPDGATVISRFFLTSDPDIADTNSEQILMIISQPFDNHNGGQLSFGPDGYLYIGMGDGGYSAANSIGDPQTNAQNRASLLGKLLRIDTEAVTSPYGIPTNNPFVQDTNYAPEIWALGLRNPWRFSFDRLTGDLYIGDVGHFRWEEIDFQPVGSGGGQNYGWRIREGPTNYIVPAGLTNFSALTEPVAWYDHFSVPTDGSASGTGGYVYRGPPEPRMDGVYFFGDYPSGQIWGLKRLGTNWQQLVLRAPGNPPPPTNFHISTFGEDEQGHIYFASYSSLGKIFQIQDTHQAWTPTFSPANGIINSGQVIVTCVSTGAVIHYTTNGLDPTELDSVVPANGIIPVTTGFTNKARAFRADLAPSVVANAIFTNKVATPVFSPPSGPITNGSVITMTTITPDATIYYTTNGSTPTASSLVYAAPVSIRGGTTLKAIGIKTGYVNSAIQSASYPLIQVATPIFEPPNGPITNGTSVFISCSTPGSTIYYTLDGSMPNTNSSIYAAPLVLNTPVTLTAWGFRSDYTPGNVASVFYGREIIENTVVTTVASGLASPRGICFDASSNLVVACIASGSLRKISPGGQIATVASIPAPTGVCIDSIGNIYVSDGNCNRLWKISTDGTTAPFAPIGGCSFNDMGQLEIDPGGNVYAGFYSTVQKITPDGTVTQLGGPGGSGNFGWEIYVGVGIDLATNIYATTEYKIWKIAPDGATTLVAGAQSAFSDGSTSIALFQHPQDAVVDSSTNIYVSDLTAIRKIHADGMVTTLAGGGTTGYKNGPGYAARFNGVAGLCLDTNGNVYVADTTNNCIRKISPDTAGIGIADDWQLSHFGYIGIDPNADPDNDGSSNFNEFWAGTDPLDSNSVFGIDDVSILTNTIRVSWRSVLGKSYLVKYSADLKTWNSLGTSIPGTGSMLSVVDSTPIGQYSQRFYRIFLAEF